MDNDKKFFKLDLDGPFFFSQSLAVDYEGTWISQFLSFRSRMLLEHPPLAFCNFTYEFDLKATFEDFRQVQNVKKSAI